MKRLYIIGNGFDLEHGLETKYSQFKKYLINKHPNYYQEYDGLLESKIGNHGEIVFDMDELVGAIISVIDHIDSEFANQKDYPEWNKLEEHVGTKYAYTILDHNEFFLNKNDWGNMNDSYDKVRISSYNNNEILSGDLEAAYTSFKGLFDDWVRDYCANISFDCVGKIDTPSFKDSVFLNFNYTSTLEDVYGVDRNNICYVHGYAKDYNSEIFFGHGEKNVRFELSDVYLGAENSFEDILKKMRKDTEKAFRNNTDFFNRLGSIEEIYSFGFSFSDVDMEYIDAIRSRVNVEKVIWYFNKHDYIEKRESIKRIADMGFKVAKTEIW